jgi:hypothetical protein
MQQRHQQHSISKSSRVQLGEACGCRRTAVTAKGWGPARVVGGPFHASGEADSAGVPPILHVALVNRVGVRGVARVDGGDHPGLGGGRHLDLAVALKNGKKNPLINPTLGKFILSPQEKH